MRMNVTRPMPKVDCPDCDGFGDFVDRLQGREPMTCRRCRGTGKVYEEDVVPSDGYKQPIKDYEKEND